MVGRHRHIGQRKALDGAENQLVLEAFEAVFDELKKLAGGIAGFATVNHVGFGIPFGSGRDGGGPPRTTGSAGAMGARD